MASELLLRDGFAMSVSDLERGKLTRPRLTGDFIELNNATVLAVQRDGKGALAMKSLFRMACRDVNWHAKDYKTQVFRALLGAKVFPTTFQERSREPCYAFWLYDQLHTIGSTALQYMTKIRSEIRTSDSKNEGHLDDGDDESIKSGPGCDDSYMGKRKAGLMNDEEDLLIPGDARHQKSKSSGEEPILSMVEPKSSSGPIVDSALAYKPKRKGNGVPKSQAAAVAVAHDSIVHSIKELLETQFQLTCAETRESNEQLGSSIQKLMEEIKTNQVALDARMAKIESKLDAVLEKNTK